MFAPAFMAESSASAFTPREPYSRFGYRTANGGFWGDFTSVRRANVWEFPNLGNSQGYMVDVSTGNQQFYTQHGSWESDAGGGVVIGGGVGPAARPTCKGTRREPPLSKPL
jgi:hypothetical protein